MVATHLFCIFTPNLGKIPILTHIFQMGWFNHQPVRRQLDSLGAPKPKDGPEEMRMTSQKAFASGYGEATTLRTWVGGSRDDSF